MGQEACFVILSKLFFRRYLSESRTARHDDTLGRKRIEGGCERLVTLVRT